jgi:hypothetical protein
VAVGASPLLLERFVRDFNPGQFAADIVVAFDTEVRHLFLENCVVRGSVGVMAGCAWVVNNRWVKDRRFFQGFGKIRMAF